MQKLIEVIELVADKYINDIQLILNRDMLVLEYMYIINGELDVYRTIEVREFKDKLNITIIPDRVSKIITINELEELFKTLKYQSTHRNVVGGENK